MGKDLKSVAAKGVLRSGADTKAVAMAGMNKKSQPPKPDKQAEIDDLIDENVALKDKCEIAEAENVQLKAENESAKNEMVRQAACITEQAAELKKCREAHYTQQGEMAKIAYPGRQCQHDKGICYETCAEYKAMIKAGGGK